MGITIPSVDQAEQGGETVRHFQKGFVWGFLLVGLLVWLFREWLFPKEEVLLTTSQPVEVKRPSVEEQRISDDLTLLRGIGPAFARRLHQAGIHTYTQLARLTPEQLAKRCEVDLGRIQRDDWIGQAAALAK
jgi:hypothetical protein